jgi:RHS repeat-associated protein
VTRLRNAPDGSSVTTAVTQLEYDGQGLLLRITEDGNDRRLVRDRAEALARPLMEMGVMTNAVRWFVWANGKLLAQVASNGTIRVAHSDELGKILALTDNNGALTDEYAYQPYGRIIAHSGTSDLPFAFMGDYGVWDAGNGLYITRHRAYDANLMRFLQPDPIGLEGGYNVYAYASGSPSWFIDPLGLWDVIYNSGGNSSPVTVTVNIYDMIYSTQDQAATYATENIASQPYEYGGYISQENWGYVINMPRTDYDENTVHLPALADFPNATAWYHNHPSGIEGFSDIYGDAGATRWMFRVTDGHLTTAYVISPLGFIYRMDASVGADGGIRLSPAVNLSTVGCGN